MEELEGLSAQELLDKRDGIELEIREQLAVLEQVKLWETMNWEKGLATNHHKHTIYVLHFICFYYVNFTHTCYI